MGVPNRHIRLIAIVLLIFFGIVDSSFSQTRIGGVINDYAHVTALKVGSDSVIVATDEQFLQFSVGDTVLLIQMKGAIVYTDEPGDESAFGRPKNRAGVAGAQEFFIVNELDRANRCISFSVNIKTEFCDSCSVQLVRVPSFHSARVTSELTASPWDSTSVTGGILALFAGKKLVLDAPIDVTGKGFKGGAVSSGDLIPVENNFDKLFEYRYSVISDSAGFKGEGLAINTYPYWKGRGANFTGGGGGNGAASGGGGGSNYGAGGRGGYEISGSHYGGNGGFSVSTTNGGLDDFSGGLFLGGGGGASRFSTGTASAGGNGGGIVIIICDSLIIGNDNRIIADGETPATAASGMAGAGGGGGGGSIAIYAQGFTDDSLVLSVKGGKGGSHSSEPAGEGGGGGGGYITTSHILGSKVVMELTGGKQGDNTDLLLSGVPSGNAGDSTNDFVPNLNGFLFNVIWSEKNGSYTDSICSDIIPQKIIGSVPQGTAPFEYSWQRTVDVENQDSYSVIPDAVEIDYTSLTVESDTFWVRRIVKDSSSPLNISDTSNWVAVFVQPEILNNQIGADTLICYGQETDEIRPTNGNPSGGNGSYSYQWIQSNDNRQYSAITSGDYSSSLFTPPVLFDTVYYKRVVTSGRCVDTSNVITITVLPAIEGNIVSRSDSIICEGSLFSPVDISTPTGGDGSYSYLWQESFDNDTWTSAYGSNASALYTPDTSRFRNNEQIYYRRRVISGDDDVCRVFSSPILMTRYHAIANNFISADDVICEGSVPDALTGTTPVNGSGQYTYIWQDSTSQRDWTDRGTENGFVPQALTDSTWYRRIVNSSVCSDTSALVVINVHKTITGNVAAFTSGVSDTTICHEAIPNVIKGTAYPSLRGGTDIDGDYAYQWLQSSDNENFTTIDGAVNVDYQPGKLMQTTWYKRRTISGECTDESVAVKVTVLGAITNNTITSSQTICYNTIPANLEGPFPDGGDPDLVTWIWQQSIDGGVTWTVANGAASQRVYAPGALTTETSYRRIVLSGAYDCCVDTSNTVTVSIYQLPVAEIVSGADVLFCEGEEVAIPLSLTGASDWDVTYLENSTEIVVNGITDSSTELKRIPDLLDRDKDSTILRYSLVRVVDNNGCVATSMNGSVEIVVYNNPDANAGNDIIVCGPEVVMAAEPSYGKGTWMFPSVVLSGNKSISNTFVTIDSSFTEASVTYPFIWEEKNNTCADRDTVNVLFYNRIEPVSAGNDTIFASFDQVLSLKASSLKPHETGIWSVEQGEGSFAEATYSTTEVRNVAYGENVYQWRVENGVCVATALVNIDVLNVVVPEGLSPNGDGINDLLEISGLELDYQTAELNIVNGAGKRVFSTSNNGGALWLSWDGRNSSGDHLPEGTYHYLLNVVSRRTGATVTMSGFIILKRR